jgi:predicted  nucleic acid-binding Zn-ribbon protein
VPASTDLETRVHALETRADHAREDSRLYSDMIVDTNERVQRIEGEVHEVRNDVRDLQGSVQRLEQRLDREMRDVRGALAVIAQALNVELPPPAAGTDPSNTGQ